MPSENLHAPWRMEYIRSLSKQSDSDRCFICDAANAQSDDERRSRFVLWTTEQSVVLMNLYPYTNGHLLIAPKAHKPELEQLSSDELLDLQMQTVNAMKLLRKACSPQGFNLGMNLGRSAGAGVPGHLHQHVVPRWAGDTNFMSIIGDVRVVPQAVQQLYDELARVRNER